MSEKPEKKPDQKPLIPLRQYLVAVSGATLLLIFAAMHEYWILFYNAYGCELFTDPEPGAGIIAEEHCAPARSPYFQLIFKFLAVSSILGILTTGFLQRWKEAFIVAGTLVLFSVFDLLQILIVAALSG